jgi:hypothetical protein
MGLGIGGVLCKEEAKRPHYKWSMLEDNIKIHLRELGCEWEVDQPGSGPCPSVGFDISGD